jgi:uncharacterized membrane protein required for colicin V production
MGIWLSPVLVSMAEPWLPEILFEPLPRLVLYILSFALVTGSFVVLSKLLDRLIGDTPLGWADHLVGALAGLLISVLVISVLLNLIHLAGLYEAISPEMSDRELLIYDLLRVPAPALFHHFRDTLPSLPDGLPRGGA